jgi:precorrin-3B synthase
MTAVQASGAPAVRVTPWRRLLLEGARCTPRAGLLIDNHSPELHTRACIGAPGCEQASVATHLLARRLSRAVGGHRLHVSGCSKGCADSRPAGVCVVGRDGRYDLVFDGRADAPPRRENLTEAQVLDYFGAD